MHKLILVFQFVTQFFLPTQSSQVQSSPDGLINARQQLFCLLTMAASRMHTHQQSQVRSSPTTVDDSKSLQATCPIYARWTQVIVRDGCNSESRTACGAVYSLVESHWTIYNASRCEHANRDKCLGKKCTADGRR